MESGTTGGAAGCAPREPTIYQVVLQAHVGPIWPYWTFGLVAGGIFALIGHPLAALASTLVCGASDLVLQRTFRRWLAKSDGVDPEVGLSRLSDLVMWRNTLALACPTVVALATRSQVDLVYLLVGATTFLLLATTQSLLSAKLFRKSAAPALAAMTVAGFAVQTRLSDLAIFGLLAGLIAIVGLIGAGAETSKATWMAEQAEKNRLIAELTTARDEARRASQAKSTFLATMSHEIRTPMNGVLGMAQSLMRSRLTAAQRGQVETVLRSGEILMTVLNDLLDISKLDAGRMEIAAAPCDLRALMTETLDAWAPVAEERGLALSLEIDDALPPYLKLDAARVRQVLFNLIGNALKFTPSGEVLVTVGVRPDRRLLFTVRDTGVGIPAEAMPRLFEAFSQADNSDVRKFGGTGLGLAICHHLCALMGGEIAAESTVGQGTALRFLLPLEETGAPLAAAPAEPEPAPAPVEGTNGLSILVADDNPTNLLVLEHLLGALGYNIYKANDGREALEALDRQVFDLVLMDIQMPEMTGIDVLQAVRARPGPNRDTPLIAVTADAMSSGRDRYIDLGFAGFVAKPVQASTLINAMMAAVANTGAEDEGEAEAATA
jgi:signal transduction histidine kinase/CheY-like chemotaxis protein